MITAKITILKSFFCITFLAISSFKGNAQQLTGISKDDLFKPYSVSAPDVYSFEKYSLQELKGYTGKSAVSIPVYTIRSGNITYPISLVYDSGGIKVDQLASNVGLGWSLSTAMITRTIHYDNDFDNTGSLTLQPDYASYSESDRLNDFHFRRYNGYSGKIGYFLQRTLDKKADITNKYVDFLPDVYNFYSDAFSTKFFFRDLNTPVELHPKGTRITAVKDIRRFDAKQGYYTNGVWRPNYNLLTHDFFSISVLTNTGIKYLFEDVDLSLTQRLDDYVTLSAPAQISAWHISRIEDTRSEKRIVFEYETTDSNPNGPHPNGEVFLTRAGQRAFDYTEYQEPNQVPDPNGCYYYTPYNSNDFKTYDLKTSARVDVALKRLKKIKFEDGEIVFCYNENGARKDIYNGDYVSGIQIKDKGGKEIKAFAFTYGYFTSDFNVGEFNPDGGAINNYRYKRLKLLSVQETGKPAYKFTYNEAIQLPPVNSFSVDFLGYFNKSADVTNATMMQSTRPNPELYFYPNKFESSLLPFPIKSQPHRVIPGIFDRQANEFSKAWSLTRIVYPTGGSSQFEYESNDFVIMNEVVKGGGIRIKKQILNDGYGNARTRVYSYTNENGKSSGVLASIPYFGHPTKKFYESGIDFRQNPPVLTTPAPNLQTILPDKWKLFDKSNLKEDITHGAYVGYSRVIEKEAGNGWTETRYTAGDSSGFKNLVERVTPYYGPVLTQFGRHPDKATCMDHFLIANSGMDATVFTDNSYKRGQVLQENIVNEQGRTVRKTVYTYTDNQSASFTYYQPNIYIYHTRSEHNHLQLFASKKNYFVSNFLPDKKTVTLFDEAGQALTTVFDYTYNQNGLLKTEKARDSDGKNYLTKYFYTPDVTAATSLAGGTLSASEWNAYKAMANRLHNNIATPVQIERYADDRLLEIVRKTYNNFDYLLPEALKVSKSALGFTSEYLFYKYDSGTANPIEIAKKDNLRTVLIWGYNKTRIIAKIENAQYRHIPQETLDKLQKLSDADFSISAENELRKALNDLRKLSVFSGSFVTTYTYNPLVGVTSTTDPRGFTTFYEYDQYNRLSSIRDHDGKIISRNEYHFTNQNQ